MIFRRFLWSFRLPGESQKIERIMERFAQQFVQTNPGILNIFENRFIDFLQEYFRMQTCAIQFPTRASCSTLCSTIPMSRIVPLSRDTSSWIRLELIFFLNFSINLFQELLDNESVSVQVLQNCYDSIRTKPFKIPEDETSQFSRLNLNKKTSKLNLRYCKRFDVTRGSWRVAV